MAIIKINPKEPFSEERFSENSYKYKSIEEIYEQARKWRIAATPFDIKSFLIRSGVKIVYEEMDSDCSGYIEKRINTWVVGINQYQILKRQRFTLAHEFAHFLFDKEHIEQKGRIEDLILFRDQRSTQIERRANEFAGKLLMPDNLFKKYLEQGYRKLSVLSDKFDVSLAAVRYRAFKLGYLKEY